MSAQNLLEQLLKSGLSMIQNGSAGSASLPSASRNPHPAAPGSGAPGAPGRPADGFAWGTFGAGAASGGALAMLLGNRRVRGMGGKALKVGSVAAIGALAYKAYGAWQAQQQANAAASSRTASGPAATGAQPPAALPGPAGWASAATTPARMADRVGGAELEQHSRAMLLAMVAAAKADGHLDDRERGLVEAELHRLEADGAVRGWIDAELRRPLDPAEVARTATSPELAAEMYLASLLVADDTNRMERLYLDELAREMRLPDGLKAQLEAQAVAAG